MTMNVTKEQFVGAAHSELLAENATLRDQLDTARHNARRNLREYVRVCRENDKLLELVRDMRTCIDHACMCEFCPLFASEDIGELRCIADVKSHMCELGLEVE